ncbi:hypothetical protein P3T37_000739 [Kitasatospora sp. MAA4]|uniref:acyl-CoA carboxylase subunit epsilon n=1 Tax=Kitasatospora sp. MAA4 TaxID=3035093 RepID=UPI0024734A13|nr:acyl-CoA carboxylase subunit epsilon [Kitasatospora sp. MAA4]MDH6131370.1 hypothetical protein [Kitasatospora sp. MAA4]
MTNRTTADIVITRGTLTDEELAALTAVLLTRAAARSAAAATARRPIPATRRHPLTLRPVYFSPTSWQQAA